MTGGPAAEPRGVPAAEPRGVQTAEPRGVPAAIALSPILSARYRPQDLERIAAAAPGARLVMVSRDGHADSPVDDVEVLLRGALSTDAFDRFLGRAPKLRCSTARPPVSNRPPPGWAGSASPAT